MVCRLLALRYSRQPFTGLRCTLMREKNTTTTPSPSQMSKKNKRGLKKNRVFGSACTKRHKGKAQYSARLRRVQRALRHVRGVDFFFFLFFFFFFLFCFVLFRFVGTAAGPLSVAPLPRFLSQLSLRPQSQRSQSHQAGHSRWQGRGRLRLRLPYARGRTVNYVADSDPDSGWQAEPRVLPVAAALAASGLVRRH